MFLPQSVLEEMLHRCGIDGWNKLYLSSEVGKRKDTAELYRHVLRETGLSPRQVVMIGDNARSDCQIPCDMGMQSVTVLQPKVLASAYPQMHALIRAATQSNNLQYDTALGLVIHKLFATTRPRGAGRYAFFPYTWQDIGYAFLGPALVGFAQWIAQEAEDSGIDCFFFLARDGKIMKQVYDLYHDATGQGPESVYLIASRRAVTVPAIRDTQDIEAIAGVNYFENTLELFMEERFGVQVTEEDIATLRQKKLLPQDSSKVTVLTSGDRKTIFQIVAHFAERIFAGAAHEGKGLFAYLDSVGFLSPNSAVVDVGYSGTIQGCLAKFLEAPTHGLYMFTTTGAYKLEEVDSSYKGYLAEDQNASESPYYQYSFFLERLLSADETQLRSYSLSDAGEFVLEYKDADEELSKTESVRADLHKGLHAFIADFFRVRESLLSDFTIPKQFVRDMYLTIGKDIATHYTHLSEELALDDYYCGRGIV